MKIPRKSPTAQPAFSPGLPGGPDDDAAVGVPAGPDIEPWPDNDIEGPGPVPGTAVCPCCQRPYFGPASSELLDLALQAHECMRRLKAVLESVVVP